MLDEAARAGATAGNAPSTVSDKSIGGGADSRIDLSSASTSECPRGASAAPESTVHRTLLGAQARRGPAGQTVQYPYFASSEL